MIVIIFWLFIFLFSFSLVALIRYIRGKFDAIQYRSFATSNKVHGYKNFGDFEKYDELLEYYKNENSRLKQKVSQWEEYYKSQNGLKK